MKTKKVGVLESTSLLVHHPLGQRTVKSCERVSDLAWPASLSSFLARNQVNYCSRLQAYLWPALSQLASVVAVAGAQQGKTVAWVLPLLASLANRELYSGMSEGPGPVAVVLCSCQDQAGEIGAQLEEVAKGAELQVKVLFRIGESLIVVNGCDVLVTTAPRLICLLEGGLTDLSRVCHLVVEDSHTILQFHESQVYELISNWRGEKNVRDTDLPDQMVVVGEKWDHRLQNFTEKILNKWWKPHIVFGCLLEAALYSRITLRPPSYQEKNEARLSDLIDLLKSRRNTHITVICCRTVKNATALQQLLDTKGLLVETPKEDLGVADLVSMMDVWARKPHTPLLISDQQISDLDSDVIPGKANILIHWNMPKESKKLFGLRFLFIKESMEQKLLIPDVHVEVHLLLSPEDHSALPVLLSWVRRGGVTPTQPLLAAENVFRAKQERETSLCTGLARSGICPAKSDSDCSGRHHLTRPDDGYVSLAGVIEFHVLGVESPVSCWVRMVGTEEDEAQARLVLGMAMHFSRPESQRPHLRTQLVPGTMVGVRLGEEPLYHRAKISGMVEKREKKGKRILAGVKVFLVDQGSTCLVSPGNVSFLPLRLGKVGLGARKVTVSGLLPGQQEPEWGEDVRLEVASHLLHPYQGEHVCRGRVVLATPDMIWLDRCQVMVRQASLARYVCVFETKSWLLDSQLGVSNLEHKLALERIAKEVGLEMESQQDVNCSSSVEESVPDSISPGPDLYLRSSFLPLDESISVFMTECVSPSHFYLQPASGVASLLRLEQEARVDEPGRVVDCPAVGSVVLVKLDQDGRCQRALVRGQEEEMELFLVDTGEVVQLPPGQTYPCSASLVSRLPGQAVRCRLGRVRPVDQGVWSREVGDTLFNLTRDPDTDRPVVLVCRVTNREVESGEVCYSVVLTNTNNTTDEDLEEELVAVGVAEWESKNLVDIPALEKEHFDMLEVTKIGDEIINLQNLARDQQDPVALDEPAPHYVPQSVPQSVSQPTLLSCGSTPPALQTVPIPLDLPGLGLVRRVSTYTRQIGSIVWYQGPSTLSLQLKVASLLPIQPSQVHLRVNVDAVEVQIVEHGQDGRDTVLHTSPASLGDLWGEVDPSLSKVQFVGHTVKVELSKVVNIDWPWLTRVKSGLVRYQEESVETGEEDEIKIDTRNETVGILGFLNEILPEQHFDSSDDEDDLIPDKNALENSIDEDGRIESDGDEYDDKGDGEPLTNDRVLNTEVHES